MKKETDPAGVEAKNGIHHIITGYDFKSAASAVLEFLHKKIGFNLWMVTRTEGDDWIVLQTKDTAYGMEAGKVFRWADSFCSRMTRGIGPRIAPSSDLVSVYASAPIAQQVAIKAYIGVPLNQSDGTLFGTLCAIDANPQPEIITRELPLIELLSQLLSALLNAELKADEQTRLAERVQVEALTDSLTGLYNRRGWDQLLDAEESRCRRYGHPACVISIDLDGLKQVNDSLGHAKGDEFIHRAGQVLSGSRRNQDVIARVGGDEFAILVTEANVQAGQFALKRFRSALAEAGISASLGIAKRHPTEGLLQAWKDADQAMYVCKQQRKSESSRAC